MSQRTLLAVPNVSEGSDPESIEAIGRAISASRATGLGDGPRLLDVHSDADHDRSVFTFAAPPRALSEAMLSLASETFARIDLRREGRTGQHPHVGALDVAPVVYTNAHDRGIAYAETLVLAARIGEELDVPVFLYGEITESASRSSRTRAELRRGGLPALAERIREGELRPDFGPPAPSPSAGVTLVAARPPLVAFNLQLAPPASLADARRIAALVREGGEHGLPGLRAIGIELSSGLAQVSMNVERPIEVPLAEVVRAVVHHAPLLSAELVGLTPLAALDGFPAELPMPGFDPERHVIENALGS